MGSRGKKKRGPRAAGNTRRLGSPVESPIRGVAPRAGTRKGVLVGGTRYASATEGGEGTLLDLLDLDADPAVALVRLRLPFLAHGFAPHPRRPHQAALFEKWGVGGAFVDLRARAVLATLAPKPGHQFYGHGVFSKGGEVVFAVETNLATRAGVITVRDGATFSVLDEMPSFGQKPHDCMLIDGGEVLAITNGGGLTTTAEGGSVTFVSISDRRLLDRREIPNARLNAGHIAMTARGDFAVVSAPREGLPELSSPGGVSLSVGGGAVTTMARPADVAERVVGEALSVCIHEPSGHVVATHPYANLVTIWQLRNKSLVRTLELTSPRGVTLTLDGDAFVIAHGAEATTLELEATRLVPGATRGSRVFGGSHVYTWAYPAETPPDTAVSASA